MKVFHYNDEERELHGWLAARGHENTVIPASGDPFAVVKRESFDSAFIGLHPHGMGLIRELHAVNPDCLVTMITADRDTRRAVEAIRAGAFDYLLSPPLDFTEVERTYILLDRERQQQQQRRKFQDQLDAASAGTRLVGTSEPVQNLRQLIAKAARTRASVLITGETGTGKELIARMLHEQSPRSMGPFIAVNCNAIPSTLLESELFGHKKGSFTGADRDRAGLLVEAEGGSFFFDEIHDLELLLQGKLLRALQEEEVRPVGGRASVKLNVRIIAATNQDLPALVASRRFRQDLFYRLNVVPIRVPPLRERTEDIALLARHFIDIYSKREGRDSLKISTEIWRWMDAHPWPGNIRELENLCQRAVALSEGDLFDTDVLALTHSHPSTIPKTAVFPANSKETDNLQGYSLARESLDRQLLERALMENKGNVLRAAKALRISRTTLYAKAQKLGVKLPRRGLPS
jgi:DNA-binding NtrC family response regulator